MEIAGATIVVHRGRYEVRDEAKLRAEIERWFADDQGNDLPSFACIERGQYSLVVLGPKDTGRLTWSFSIMAPTYRKVRAALRSLGFVSRDMRERDFTAFVH